MTELMKQRAGVVEAEQRRLAVGRLGEVQTLTISGRISPASFSWSRNEVIQAPLRFEGRAK